MIRELLDKFNCRTYHLYTHEDDVCNVSRRLFDAEVKDIKTSLLDPTSTTIRLTFTCSVFDWKAIRKDLKVYRVFEENEIPEMIEDRMVYTTD